MQSQDYVEIVASFDRDFDSAIERHDNAARAAAWARYRRDLARFLAQPPASPEAAADKLETLLIGTPIGDVNPLQPLRSTIKSVAGHMRRRSSAGLAAKVRRLASDVEAMAGEQSDAATLVRSVRDWYCRPRRLDGSPLMAENSSKSAP